MSSSSVTIPGSSLASSSLNSSAPPALVVASASSSASAAIPDVFPPPPDSLYVSGVPKIHGRMIVQLMRNLNRPTAIENDIKQKLLDIRLYMMQINGQKPDDSIIDNIPGDLCYYFQNPAEGKGDDKYFVETSGCKTKLYKIQKREIMNFLRDLIVYVFRKAKNTNAALLENMNPLIPDLKKTVEFYCHFIGGKELDPIYADHVLPLIDEVNAVIGKPILIERCISSKTGARGTREYGCGRAVRTMPVYGMDPALPNSSRVVIYSTDDSGGGSFQSPSNNSITGGSRRHRRRTHKRTHKKRRGLRSTRRR
jgi:hypothetical protein